MDILIYKCVCIAFMLSDPMTWNFLLSYIIQSISKTWGWLVWGSMPIQTCLPWLHLWVRKTVYRWIALMFKVFKVVISPYSSQPLLVLTLTTSQSGRLWAEHFFPWFHGLLSTTLFRVLWALYLKVIHEHLFKSFVRPIDY